MVFLFSSFWEVSSIDSTPSDATAFVSCHPDNQSMLPQAIRAGRHMTSFPRGDVECHHRISCISSRLVS
jgi:hypothetical protein